MARSFTLSRATVDGPGGHFEDATVVMPLEGGRLRIVERRTGVELAAEDGAARPRKVGRRRYEIDAPSGTWSLKQAGGCSSCGG